MLLFTMSETLGKVYLKAVKQPRLKASKNGALVVLTVHQCDAMQADAQDRAAAEQVLGYPLQEERL